VILSVTLPALTAAQFANKDLIISCMSIVIAAFTGLGSFYHWDRTWQKNAMAQASIEAYLAKWELELARAKEFVAVPRSHKACIRRDRRLDCQYFQSNFIRNAGLL
jgi:hypothetical protein